MLTYNFLKRVKLVHPLKKLHIATGINNQVKLKVKITDTCQNIMNNLLFLILRLFLVIVTITFLIQLVNLFILLLLLEGCLFKTKKIISY